MNLLMVRGLIALILCLTVISPCALAGVDSKSAQYVGGMWTALKEGDKGRRDLKDSKAARFIVDELHS
jgi:hypothetical protein